MTQPDEIFRLDAICSRFESEWAASSDPPDLQAFVAEVEQEHQEELLKLLLPIDVEYRRQRSLNCSTSSYVAQFPKCGSIIDQLLCPGDTVSFDQDPSLEADVEVCGDLPETVDHERAGSTVESQTPSRVQIGRYTILQQLGRGGQGAVYRAAHPTLPIEVAIKVGRRKISASARQAMLDEAHLLCDLEHPNIARIRDLDFDDSGCPILVLDLVRGRPLSQLLQSSKVSVERAAGWLASAADAVGYAHRRGVLHLDLKPGNIVIDETDKARVIDFGLARMRDAWSDPASESDGISGTPEYMPPEQADGVAEKLTAKVDIFALGAILYRILTGYAPFQAETSYKAVLRSREYDIDIAVLENSTAPRPLVDACRRAISREPRDRFENAEDFANSLRATFVEGHSVTPHRAGWVVGTIAVLGVLILALLFSRSRSSDSSDRDNGIVTNVHEETNLIESFEIKHLGNRGNARTFEEPLFSQRPPREEDDVQVTARFSQPAFCYLFALNPDGTMQLCYPESEREEQQQPITELTYPSDQNLAFGLTDGAGHQAFVLVTSEDELPSFEEWKPTEAGIWWPDETISGNWVYRDGRLQPEVFAAVLTTNRTRGHVRPKKVPKAFRAYLDSLANSPAMEVQSVLFEVAPR